MRTPAHLSPGMRGHEMETWPQSWPAQGSEQHLPHLLGLWGFLPTECTLSVSSELGAWLRPSCGAGFQPNKPTQGRRLAPACRVPVAAEGSATTITQQRMAE